MRAGGVAFCGHMTCPVVCCVVMCRRRCYQMAKGRDVYPRAKVNGLAVCVACARCVSVLLHCRTSALPQCTASLPWGSGQWTSCNTLPHCSGAVGSGPPAIHCLTAWEQWAVQLLQCTASLPGGSGPCNSCNALPHCLGAVGSATPAMHCLTTRGQWTVQLLQCTASLPWASEAV